MDLKHVLFGSAILIIIICLIMTFVGGFGYEKIDTLSLDATDTKVIAEGSCGVDVTWKLYSSNSLEISGNGVMADYYYYNNNSAPWGDYESKIKAVVINPGVKSIGDHAFYNCISLESVTIPDSVTYIGEDAFYDCISLTSITIPDSVISIGVYAFSNCTLLTSVTIPDSVSFFGKGLFTGCTSLESITIPDSVTTIGPYVFRGCTSLESITIPDSVTTIDTEAFFNCISLATVTIPDSVTTIGNQAFCYCRSLTSIIIPDSVISIGGSVFAGCSSLTSIEVSHSNDSYMSIDGVLFNKSGTDLIQYPTGKVDVDYTIPDSVTTIGPDAFRGCTSLESITIPDSVLSIGDSAFSICISLSSVTIPDSVTFIGAYAFYYCPHLTSVTIPDTVTSIASYVFSDCSSLISVTIPDTVISIGDYAFHNCSSLISVTIPDSVTSIGCSAFQNCSSLASVTIPDSVTFIERDTFSYCISLASVTIPDTVTSVGIHAFNYLHFFVDGKVVGQTAENLAGRTWVGVGDAHLYLSDISHTVFYDLDGGSGFVSSQSVVEGNNFELAPYVGIKPGYTFGGWSYAGRIYQPGTTMIMEASDMRFTAAWTKDIAGELNIFSADTYSGGDIIIFTMSFKDVPEIKSLFIRISYSIEADIISSNWLASPTMSDFNGSEGVAAWSKELDPNIDIFTLSLKMQGNTGDFTIDLEVTLNPGELKYAATKTITEVKYISGDLNKDGIVDSDDAVYLLYSSFLPDKYPLNQDGDFNDDGIVDSDDAVYLLYHTFLPDKYPLHPKGGST